MKRLLPFLMLLALCLLTSCEQPYLPENHPDTEPDAQPNVVLRVQGFDIVPFDDVDTRADERVEDVCSRLNFVVYIGETKVKSIAQKRGDADFGTVALALPQGDYTYAVVAHSSEGSATVTSLDKISFKNNRVTDTFSHCGQLTVGEQNVTEDIYLRRNTAMFRLNLSEPLPEQVTQLKFYYTGGSSTLSARTGYGSVKSKQTVVLDVQPGQQVFEVYTIPWDEEGVLKMTVTAMDAAENVIQERIFTDVPVRRNRITVYTCAFSASPQESSKEGNFQFHLDAEWEGEDEYVLPGAE